MEVVERLLKRIGLAVVIIAVTALVAFITGLIIMLLWNWLMPMIFGVPTITFIQGWGLAFLCGTLFPRINIKD